VTFSNVTLKGIYGVLKGEDDDNEVDQYGVSASGEFGAATVTAYYRALDDDNAAQWYGIGASYDLGGGLAVAGGVVQQDFEDIGGDSDTLADFGLSFSF
jgi:outer membrane protein OmpU